MLFPTEDIHSLTQECQLEESNFPALCQKQIPCAVCRKPRTSLKAKQANKHLNTVHRKVRELSVVQHASLKTTDDPLCELVSGEAGDGKLHKRFSNSRSKKRKRGGEGVKLG